jgi:hypothetical protein
MKYTIGYNMVGYMPDQEPADFDDPNEALEAMAWEMEKFADQGSDSPSISDQDECHRLRAGAAYFRNLKGILKEESISYRINGWNYWIQVGEDS